MRTVISSVSIIGPFLKGRRLRQTTLLVALFLCAVEVSWGQLATAPQAQAPSSLADSLKRSDRKETQLHIFYVHGMGIDTNQPNAGTQNFEVSEPFRKSFCKVIGCTANQFEGRSYANEGDFAPDATPPPLSYFGEEIWKRDMNDWRAAAPFVDHYKLVTKSGTTIYVDEINWWPLILSAKCRQIVAKEVALIGLDKKHFEICAAKTMQDPNHQNRFTSYAWITGNDIQQHQTYWPKPALLNRSLKRDILDWGFADALLAVGPMQDYLVEGIREVVLASVNPAENQEFVVVSHSLGSYLMFSALDLESGPQQERYSDWKKRFQKVLRQTSHAYFMANQVRLLELADLDNAKSGSLNMHLEHWGHLRAEAHQDPPRIVAWSDPDDLLTWEVPDPDQSAVNGTNVDNRPVENAPRWFWLLESPEKAHSNYEQNKRVIHAMIPKSNAHQTNKENGTKAAASTSPPDTK
jgi:hypothetical protein